MRKFWPFWCLIFVEMVLFSTSYKADSFLIGWDNLYPELNPLLNIQRSFFSVWQEYRGLSYMDGMSHAANLFHDIFRMMLSLIMPTHLVRWVTIFLTHIAGGIGMYILLNYYVLNRDQKNAPTRMFIALLGAFFYQYNLITVQQYFLPFELFLFHFAALPWSVYFALRYLDKGMKKDLIASGIVCFLTLPQAHVPTIFIVYAMALGIIFLTRLFGSASDRTITLKRIVILSGIIFAINAYWGISFTYATIQNSHVIANSKNNQMGTDDIFYRNLKWGTLDNVLLMKGIVLDYWQQDITAGDAHTMMHPWTSHIRTPFFLIPAWIFVLLTATGYIFALKSRDKALYPLAVLFLFAFSMMANNTPIVGHISQLMREYVPLFHNIFRFVFTKFSFLYAFTFAIFLAYGIAASVAYIKTAVGRNMILALLGVLLISYTFPSFQNHFFYENLAVKMPKAYFQVFDFFKTKNLDQRVVILPIPSYWAWTQNNWNTIGSGFLWYGIPQPTIDRAFDPWSDKNENAYFELDQAIFAEDDAQLTAVFRKYDFHYVLFDRSIMHASAQKFDMDRYADTLEKTGRFKKVRTFDFIDIYEFVDETDDGSRLRIIKETPNVGPIYNYDNFDVAISTVDAYISDPSSDYDTYYPFRNLFAGKNTDDQEYSVTENGDSIEFSSVIPPSNVDRTIAFTLPLPEEFSVFGLKDQTEGGFMHVDIYLDEDLVLLTDDLREVSRFSLAIEKNKAKILRIAIKKSSNILYDSRVNQNLQNTLNDGCEVNGRGTADIHSVGNGVEFTSINSSNCIKINEPNMIQRLAYLVRVRTTNSPIKGLFFNIVNKETRKSDLETYFDHDGSEQTHSIITSPRNNYGLGYEFYFNNISFGEEKVVNRLDFVEIYQIPYYFLKNITVKNQDSFAEAATKSSSVLVEKLNPSLYHVSVPFATNKTRGGILYFSQSFDPGWVAYETDNTWFPFFGRSLTDHVLVNNWANAWRIEDPPKSADQTIQEPSTNNSEKAKDELRRRWNNRTFVIVFWPQYLQYLGFGILGATILYLIALTLPKPLSHKTKNRPPSNNT